MSQVSTIAALDHQTPLSVTFIPYILYIYIFFTLDLIISKDNFLESFNICFFPTILAIGFIVKVCQTIFYYIKCKNTLLPSAPQIFVLLFLIKGYLLSNFFARVSQLFFISQAAHTFKGIFFIGIHSTKLYFKHILYFQTK